MRGDWRVSTGDGGVKILLPQDFNADIEATTGDGGIATEGVELASSPGQNGEQGRGSDAGATERCARTARSGWQRW